MNIFPFLATVVFAAESFLSPLSNTAVKPVLSFADLMKTGAIVPDRVEVLGTGTFSARIVGEEAVVPELRVTKKTHYTVVFLGDSMIDTLGSDLRLIQDEFLRVYPATTFTLLNYGVGGENIVSGLERVTRDTSYMGLPRPAIIATRPDIVVVESFAYNPFSFDIGAMEQHWLSLAYVVDAMRANLPDTKIVIAATIAPNSTVFGDGAPSLAFGAQDKRERTGTIKRYLVNTIRFAKSQHLPLADAYHASLDTNGEGKLFYINPGDHIHYSDAGRQLFARTVVDAIVSNKLLEDSPLEARPQ